MTYGLRSALALVAALGLLGACSEAGLPNVKEETEAPQPGRITAIAATIWACPLENWRLRADDGCDPIETGTAIKILRRGVNPDYPHGPFALIEYTHEGVTKFQYVVDINVTPLSEDEASVEELVERERSY